MPELLLALFGSQCRLHRCCRAGARCTRCATTGTTTASTAMATGAAICGNLLHLRQIFYLEGLYFELVQFLICGKVEYF